jgi:hypothetical protein
MLVLQASIDQMPHTQHVPAVMPRTLAVIGKINQRRIHLGISICQDDFVSFNSFHTIEFHECLTKAPIKNPSALRWHKGLENSNNFVLRRLRGHDQ